VFSFGEACGESLNQAPAWRLAGIKRNSGASHLDSDAGFDGVDACDPQEAAAALLVGGTSPANRVRTFAGPLSRSFSTRPGVPVPAFGMFHCETAVLREVPM